MFQEDAITGSVNFSNSSNNVRLKLELGSGNRINIFSRIGPGSKGFFFNFRLIPSAFYYEYHFHKNEIKRNWTMM